MKELSVIQLEEVAGGYGNGFLKYLMMIKSLNTPPPMIFDIKLHHYYD